MIAVAQILDERFFIAHCLPYTGAIYLTENSELNVTEGGSVYFVNNHAADYGGKY